METNKEEISIESLMKKYNTTSYVKLASSVDDSEKPSLRNDLEDIIQATRPRAYGFYLGITLELTGLSLLAYNNLLGEKDTSTNMLAFILGLIGAYPIYNESFRILGYNQASKAINILDKRNSS